MPVLEAVEKNENAFYFAEPVDPIALGIPTYFQVIKKPMDFSTIRKKISECQYESVKEFSNDLYLVFTNAILFNHPDSIVCQTAEKLLKEAKKINTSKITSV